MIASNRSRVVRIREQILSMSDQAVGPFRRVEFLPPERATGCRRQRPDPIESSRGALAFDVQFEELAQDLFAPQPVFPTEQQVRLVVEVNAVEPLLSGRLAVEDDHRIDHSQQRHAMLRLEGELGIAIERMNLDACLIVFREEPPPRTGGRGTHR